MNWEKPRSIATQPSQDQLFKIQIFNIWMNWEKLSPNLSFTVENKIRNSHKKKNRQILKLTLIIEICHFLKF